MGDARKFIALMGALWLSYSAGAGTLTPLSDGQYQLLQSAEGGYDVTMEGWEEKGTLSLIDFGKKQMAITVSFKTRQGGTVNLSLPWVRYDEGQKFYEAFDFGGDYPGHWKWDELTQYLRFRLRQESGRWQVTATLLSQQQHISIHGSHVVAFPKFSDFPSLRTESDITGKYVGTDSEGHGLQLLVTRLDGHYIGSLTQTRLHDPMRFCSGIPGDVPNSMYLTTCRPSTPAQVFVQLRGNFVENTFHGAYILSSGAKWRELKLTREAIKALNF